MLLGTITKIAIYIKEQRSKIIGLDGVGMEDFILRDLLDLKIQSSVSTHGCLLKEDFKTGQTVALVQPIGCEWEKVGLIDLLMSAMFALYLTCQSLNVRCARCAVLFSSLSLSLSADYALFSTVM